MGPSNECIFVRCRFTIVSLFCLSVYLFVCVCVCFQNFCFVCLVCLVFLCVHLFVCVGMSVYFFNCFSFSKSSCACVCACVCVFVCVCVCVLVCFVVFHKFLRKFSNVCFLIFPNMLLINTRPSWLETVCIRT